MSSRIPFAVGECVACPKLEFPAEFSSKRRPGGSSNTDKLTKAVLSSEPRADSSDSHL